MQKKNNNIQVATKADILQLQQSTKSDIQRLEQSTKADSGSLRTEFRNFRSDVRRTEKSLRGEILRVEVRVENIEDSQKRVETKIDKIANTLDGFVRRVDNLTTDNEVGANQIHELRKNIKDHETRITQLESASQTP